MEPTQAEISLPIPSPSTIASAASLFSLNGESLAAAVERLEGLVDDIFAKRDFGWTLIKKRSGPKYQQRGLGK